MVAYQINPDVLSALHDERVYQNRKWGTIEQHPHEVGGYLTLMRKLLRDAENEWQSGIACLEQHGAVPRSPAAFVALQGGHISHSVEGE
jgi:hypothetical protein